MAHLQRQFNVPSGEGAVRVLVAERTMMATQLLELGLAHAEDFAVVASVTTSTRATEVIVGEGPDIALVSADLEDGPLAGLGVVRDAHMLQPATKVIVLLDSAVREVVTDAFRAGAKGVFCRNYPVATLYRCIHAVHAGQIWANSSELQYLLEALSSTAPLKVINAKGENLLTRREIDVVMAVADGLSNRQVSERLNLSEHTVKNYLFRIFDKLGIDNRVELILYALSRRDLAMVPLPTFPPYTAAAIEQK